MNGCPWSSPPGVFRSCEGRNRINRAHSLSHNLSYLCTLNFTLVCCVCVCFFVCLGFFLKKYRRAQINISLAVSYSCSFFLISLSWRAGRKLLLGHNFGISENICIFCFFSPNTLSLEKCLPSELNKCRVEKFLDCFNGIG